MKTRRFIKFLLDVSLVLLLVLSIAQPAFANGFSNQDYCEDSGGVWVGVGGSPSFGTCTYQPDDPDSQENCDQGESYQVILPEEGNPVENCLSPSSPVVETDTHHSGNSTTASVTTCTLASGDWRCAYFAEGTCAVNCYIDPHLPAGAQSALPGGVITTLYVNISPDPGGSYSVCFENPDNESLTIYQYLGGVWVALATSTNNPICASATGDGSFYLGS
jgi:hypothetical protein